MADIVLKDRNGNDLPPFEGVSKIKVYTADGSEETYINSKPVEKNVELDFADGDMEITPEEGQVFTKVYIPKPDTLIPPNVAEDVEIAGIVGTHSGGAGDDLAAGIVSRTATDIYLPEADAGEYAFYKYPTANSATVKNVGRYAFMQSGFETINIMGTSVAYQGCISSSALKKVNAPNLTTLNSGYQFNNCAALEEVNMPNVVFSSANDYVFASDSALKSYKNTAVCGGHTLGAFVFGNCSVIESIDFLSKVTISKANAFNNCPLLKKIILRSGGTGIASMFSGSENAIIYVPLALLETYESDAVWSAYINNDRMRAIEGGIAAFKNKKVIYNQTIAYSVGYYGSIDSENTEGETVTATVVSSNTEIATVSDVVVNEDTIDFNLNTFAVDGDADITITITIGENTFEKTATFSVMETIPVPTYSVSSAGASYTFNLNSTTGYYVSGNKGRSNSCALCKVTFNTQGGHLYLDCINYAEANGDFGILSTVDKTLGTTQTVDTTNVFKSFQNANMSTVQTVDYGEIAAGEHFIYVKYRKDSSVNSNNDTLQFKVRFE